MAEAWDREPEETAGIRQLASDAKSFLMRHVWWGRVLEMRVGFAVATVFGLFLVRIEPAAAGADSHDWVVVGDVPPAYLVTDDTPNPAEAMRRYVDEMPRWVDAVRASGSLDGVIPVEAEPTAEHAEMQSSRLQFILHTLVPMVE